MFPIPGKIGLDNLRSADDEELGDGEPDEELEPGGGVNWVGWAVEEDVVELGGGGGGPKSPGGRPG